MRLKRFLFLITFSSLIMITITSLPLAREKGSSIIHLDPQAKEFIARIENNPEDICLINEYAGYAARKAWYDEAVKYYEMALKLKKDDHVLWTNLGSVYIRMGKDSKAIAAFKKAIKLEPLHAIAHYNLGSIYDMRHKYDDAVREYKIALTLDPSLTNPSVNPLIVNNTLMTVLNMLLYKEREGSLSLPLQTICE